MDITEHLVEASSGGFVKGRFDVEFDQAKWWTDVAGGNLNNADDLRKLIAHEFIESQFLLGRNVPSFSLNPPSNKDEIFVLLKELACRLMLWIKAFKETSVELEIGRKYDFIGCSIRTDWSKRRF